jgi:hypothetical protein
MNAAQTLLQAIKYAEVQPQKAAELLDQLALQLSAWATQLRSSEGYIAHGGFTDKVTMQLIGPDGKVKQTVEV